MSDAEMSNTSLKALPYGVADYKVVSTQRYYVDKTLFIKELLDMQAQVYLFTRPRRFGKTLNMSMLETFFENGSNDNSVYFQDKNIWKQGEKYTSQLGAYPVIHITFKEAATLDNWTECYKSIRQILSKEFVRRLEIADNPKLNYIEKEKFLKLAKKKADKEDYADSLSFLSEMITRCYGVKPILLIDEYDAPIDSGYTNQYYSKIISFIRLLFTAALKDNPYISFAVLTGVLRVSKESLFSGLNNLYINTVLDTKFSEYFGFTVDETKDMFDYYGYGNFYETACQWYDGYKFGRTEIFNPWSIICYLNSCISTDNPEAKDYWYNTSDNKIIYDILKKCKPEVLNSIIALLHGETIVAPIDENLSYLEIRENISNVYTLLLMSGYLKTVDPIQSTAIHEELTNRQNYCLAIPNKEAEDALLKIIDNVLDSFNDNAFGDTFFRDIWDGIEQQDTQAVENGIHNFLSKTSSFFDTAYEPFYHGFMLCLCGYKWDSYYIHSNVSSGKGRYDIELEPKNHNLPGILIEIESLTKQTTDNNDYSIDYMSLQKRARKGLEQIKAKEYDTNLLTRGICHIIMIGIAFTGNNVSAVIESF